MTFTCKYAKYALLPGRIIMGATFIMASFGKFKDPAVFVNAVQSLAPWLPEKLAMVYGYALPYFELVIGVLLLVGLFTGIAAAIGSLMLISFLIALGWMQPESPIPNKDFAYLAITLALFMQGAGGLSLDGYFRGKSKEESAEDFDNEEE